MELFDDGNSQISGVVLEGGTGDDVFRVPCSVFRVHGTGAVTVDGGDGVDTMFGSNGATTYLVDSRLD
jgi:Ca2+-binding RTX toxin-like protein